MPEEYRNIYKTCRKAAGLTQEAAAERLGISVESLRAYETAQRIPPNEVVELMVILYNAQHLAYQHLRESNSLYGRIIPPLEERPMLDTCVRIFNRLREFSARHSVERLLAIAEDNVVDETERPEFDAIIEDLQEIIQSGLELAVYCESRGQSLDKGRGA